MLCHESIRGQLTVILSPYDESSLRCVVEVGLSAGITVRRHEREIIADALAVEGWRPAAVMMRLNMVLQL